MMIGETACGFQNSTRKFDFQTIILKTLSIAGIVSLTFNCNVVRAQSDRSNLTREASPSAGEISPTQPNFVRPVRQRNFHPNSGGSQKFFRQSNDNLYFLPEERSDSILEIDEDIEMDEGDTRELPEEALDK